MYLQSLHELENKPKNLFFWFRFFSNLINLTMLLCRIKSPPSRLRAHLFIYLLNLRERVSLHTGVHCSVGTKHSSRCFNWCTIPRNRLVCGVLETSFNIRQPARWIDHCVCACMCKEVSASADGAGTSLSMSGFNIYIRDLQNVH